MIPPITRRFFADNLATWKGDPFEDMEDFCLEPVITGRAGKQDVRVPRIARYIWEKQPALQAAFDLSAEEGATAFASWIGKAGSYVGLDPATTERLSARFELRQRKTI